MAEKKHSEPQNQGITVGDYHEVNFIPDESNAQHEDHGSDDEGMDQQNDNLDLQHVSEDEDPSSSDYDEQLTEAEEEFQHESYQTVDFSQMLRRMDYQYRHGHDLPGLKKRKKRSRLTRISFQELKPADFAGSGDSKFAKKYIEDAMNAHVEQYFHHSTLMN